MPEPQPLEMFALCSWFRLFGAFLISSVALGAFLTYVNFDPPPEGPWQTAWMISWNTLSLSMGLGLLWHRKWAAVLFCIEMASFGIVGFLQPLPPVPRIWNVMNIAFFVGTALFPSVITFCRWKTLR